MKYFDAGHSIDVTWSIYKGAGSIKESFGGTGLKVFLNGAGNTWVVEHSISDTGDVVITTPATLPAGTYSLRAIWIKNNGNLPCRFPNNRNIITADAENVFAISHDNQYATDDYSVSVYTGAVPFGNDGLSAYQIAVLHGETKSEDEWIKTIGEYRGVCNQLLFESITPTSENITIAYNPEHPNYYIRLNDAAQIFNLTLNNVNDGDSGYILIEQQDLRNVVFQNISGKFELPEVDGDCMLVHFFRKTNSTIILGTSETITMGSGTLSPTAIDDLLIKYYDTSLIRLQWTAPHGAISNQAVDYYDIRYSNSPVENPNDNLTWAQMAVIPHSMTPKAPGHEEVFTWNDAKPDKDYYIYIKSGSVIYGARYLSDASNPVWCKTIGIDYTETKPYRIPVREDMIHCTNVQFDKWYDAAKGVTRSRDLNYIIDEEDKWNFKENGYPDTANESFSTYVKYEGGSSSIYMKVIIDLYQTYNLDKLFFYFKNERQQFSIYLVPKYGDSIPDEPAAVVDDENKWVVVDLNGAEARFVILQYDRENYRNAIPDRWLEHSGNVWPLSDRCSSAKPIYNMHIYGKSKNNVPDHIKPVKKRASNDYSVDEFICSNGNFREDGKLASLFSGSRYRVFMDPGHMNYYDAGYPTSATPDGTPQRIADLRYRVNNIPGVLNDGNGMYYIDLLKETYSKYGLKPYIAFDNAMYKHKPIFVSDVQDEHGNYYVDKSHNRSNCPPCDEFVFNRYSEIGPEKGMYPFASMFLITCDPYQYKNWARFMYTLAAVFGKNQVSDQVLERLLGATDLDTITSERKSGLNLLSGVDLFNEPNASWAATTVNYNPTKGSWGFKDMNNARAEELAAAASAAFDGHNGRLTDEDDYSDVYGAKTADSDFLVAMPGLASAASGYDLIELIRSKAMRNDGTLPYNAVNHHSYYASEFTPELNISQSRSFAVCPEIAFKYSGYDKLLDIRDYYAPSLEFWVSELGFGENFGRNTRSRNECKSLPGIRISQSNLYTPDRHASDVKGAFTLRACLHYMSKGVNMVNIFQTYQNGNWFDSKNSRPYRQMFEWDKIVDDPDYSQPGARYDAMSQYEPTTEQTDDNGLGFFGSFTENGGYPISRAFWYIATFRNRLKGYIYTGMLDTGNDEIHIYCFKKPNEQKGAYVVYHAIPSDSAEYNTGAANVQIPVPSSVESATAISYYIPKIQNPFEVPGDLGVDFWRTGLPTSRREEWDGNQWVVKNFTKNGISESYTQQEVTYPSNPSVGDEVVTLPTPEENPYFPIVGPVECQTTTSGKKPNTRQYLDGNELKYYNNSEGMMRYRQSYAIYDYIRYSEEGIHGTSGDETVLAASDNKITVPVVDMIPMIILFDAVPETTFTSKVYDLSSRAVSPYSIRLWWNNSNVEDTGYRIYYSATAEGAYEQYATIEFGTNTCDVTGLSPSTTYYFKVVPIRGQQAGEMSDFTSATTQASVDTPDNFRSTRQSSVSIRLEWDYDDEPVEQFYGYAVYRDSGNGDFSLIATVLGQNTRVYNDTGLVDDKEYRYKLVAVALNGVSVPTEIITVRTKTPEQDQPVIVAADTDRVGMEVVVTFNLGVQLLNSAQAKAGFTLTQDGNPLTITYIYVDVQNSKKLHLGVVADSIKRYDSYIPLRLSYNAVSEGALVSETYNQEVEGFTDYTIKNWTGNFTQLIAEYKLNFYNDDSQNPYEGGGWCNIPRSVIQDDRQAIGLVDTYGRTDGGLKVSYAGKSSTGYGGIGNNPDIPTEVYSTQCGITPTEKENEQSHYIISGLHTGCRYDVLIYISRRGNVGGWGRTCLQDSWSQVVLNNSLSDEFVTISYNNVEPVGNTLDILMINPELENHKWEGGFLNYMIIREYQNSEIPVPQVPFITDITVQGGSSEGGRIIVGSNNIVLNYNCIGGTPTHYMISDSDDFSESTWQTITATISYTLPGTYGNKELYIKFKNATGDGNVKHLALVYKDMYVPLELLGVLINNDAAECISPNIVVTFNKIGNATHYRLSESSEGLEVAEWTAYSSNNVQFTLGDTQTSGERVIYAQLKDTEARGGEVISEYAVDQITYISLENETKTFKITLPSGTDTSNVNASIAPVKYNKKFAISLTVDDSNTAAWGRLFALCNGKWLDNIQTSGKYNHYNREHEDVGGGYAHEGEPLTYSDGCGVVRRFPLNVSCFLNLLNQYLTYSGDLMIVRSTGEPSANYPYTVWKEMEDILDFDGSASIHNVRNPQKQEKDGTVDDILAGFEEVETNFIEYKLGRKSVVMVEPDGNTLYTTAAELFTTFKLALKEGGANVGYVWLDMNADNPLTLTSGLVKAQRIFVNDSKPSHLINTTTNNVVTPSTGDVHKYADVGMHGISGNYDSLTTDEMTPGKIQHYIKWLFDNYGNSENGADNIWLCTPEEMIQYLLLRKYSTVSCEVVGSELEVEVTYPVLTNINWREFTINVTGLDLDTLSVTSSDFPGLSAAIKDDYIMVNANATENLESRAEKYTSRFEQSQTDENKRDALYFIQRLRSDLQTSYLNRIAVYESAPTLESFTINNGAQTTTDASVTLGFTYSGAAPTNYMVSESSDFTGAEWHALPLEPFTLDVGQQTEDKTLYFKLKNEYGISEVLNATIQYQYVNPAITLNSIEIDNGASSTYNDTVTVSVDYDAEQVTHYMASENSDFSGASWMLLSGESFIFTLSPGTGNKTIYVKLKNNTNESNSAHSSIVKAEQVFIMTNTNQSGSINVTITHGASAPTLDVDYTIADDPLDIQWGSASKITNTQTITVPSGKSLVMKSDTMTKWASGTAQNQANIITFDADGIEFGGNIMSLLSGNQFASGWTSAYAFGSLFYHNTHLTDVPLLPAQTLVQSCYVNMFNGCTAITSLPNNMLPATTLADNCYNGMFKDCSSLTGAVPELPATTLASNCYSQMFYTTKVTEIELPATTLVSRCYNEMCYKWTQDTLVRVKCLATTGFDAANALSQWLGHSVSTSGTFTKKAGVTWPEGAIPANWTVIEE